MMPAAEIFNEETDDSNEEDQMSQIAGSCPRLNAATAAVAAGPPRG